MTTYELGPKTTQALADAKCAVEQVTTTSWLDQFITISFSELNLFSFMFGVFFAVSNASLRNLREMWTMLLIYCICVALYFYFSR